MATTTATLVGVGIACLISAIIGGGLKAFGIELPVLASVRRQLLLGLAGAGLIVTGVLTSGAIHLTTTETPKREVAGREEPKVAPPTNAPPTPATAVAETSSPPATVPTTPPAYRRIEYVTGDGSVSGVFLLQDDGWHERNTQLTHDRIWQEAPDSMPDRIKLLDGKAIIEIPVASGYVYFTDPGWADYPTRKPFYRITKAVE